ncbi:MAG: hypothetical protein GWN99_02625 [Gemmatimonadetes bacterium]|uniref:Uncharacterized protein n=1 Tax=Candidatus Kutchimonas denitrificans TaxID=3056748 RepID=A0AAE5CBU3_9BACT|nr:hypothetical protein [Gemmatimonadota bacterium]NIR74850.1 hypothetical protein [Candidatus Kutchimonas denitrificans]NIR99961.1 hypothetical protein [Gemmatimonadota bacterium]NIT65545.1 hypothetical protein [Gemmatimonadota bacterium]NIU52515.1 hypothetical protein [Gemmatimonadota bacterium]
MRHRATALSIWVVFSVGGCGSAIIERSAPERPAWIEVTPAARDSMYFVGVCSDLASYEEGVNCARADALSGVAAWVGTRFSAYVPRGQSERTRAASAGAYRYAERFLNEGRRTHTYYEVRKADRGRSYYVSVLYAYPREAAEAERARIEATTLEAQRRVDGAALQLSLLAAEGRWGEAMSRLIDVAGEVAVPRNLGHDAHLERLEGVADELVGPLRLSARVVERNPKTDVVAWVDATYDSVAAAGVPVRCTRDSETVSARTDDAGLAVCRLGPVDAGAGRVIVRPDVSRYREQLPRAAGRLAVALDALLEHGDTAKLASPLTARVSLDNGRPCRRAVDTLRQRLQASGVTVVSRASGVTHFSIACSVDPAQRVGELYEAYAWASVQSPERTVDLPTSRGLGASPEAARSEAEDRLGAALTRTVLQVLREIEAGKGR